MPEERTFYSALYHSLLHPNVFGDANGDYIGLRRRGPRGARVHAIRQLVGVGRLPLRGAAAGLLVPRRTGDMVRSLLADAAQGGGLPKLPVRQPRERADERRLGGRLHRLRLRLRGRELRRPRRLGRHGQGGHRPHHRERRAPRTSGPGAVSDQGLRPSRHPRPDVAHLHRGRLGDPRVRHRRLRHLPAGPGPGRPGDCPTFLDAGAELAEPGRTRPRAISPAVGPTGPSRLGRPSNDPRCRASARTGSKKETPSSTRGAFPRTCGDSSTRWEATPRWSPSWTPSSRS